MIDEQIASARQAGYSDQEIVSFLQSNKPDLAPKISEALKAQYSPTDIINHLAPPKAGIVGNLVGGTLSTVADIAKTGEKLGLISKDTSKAADDIAASSYGGQSYGERYHKGEKNLGTGLGTALVENAPRLALDLGAGAAGASIGAALGAPFAGIGAIPGAAIGGALGSALAYGGSNLLQNYGRRLQEREDKNGGEPASATDKAIAVGTSIPQAALGALQVNKLLPAVKLGERTLTQAGTRMADAVLTGAATGAAGDVVEQAGRNLGTKDGKFDPGQTVDATVLGALTGAGVRGAGETASLARQGMNKMATRGYDHPDEVPNVAARLNEVAETNGLNLKKLNEGAQALKIVNDEIQVERTPRSIPYKEANKAIALAEQEGFDPKVITSARLALEQPKPSKDQISALQEVVKRGIELKGDWAEAQKAVDLARRSNTVQELMKRTNFSESGGEPTIKAGGLSGLADAGFQKLMSTILSPIGGAGALGGAAYAGYAGLPAATAMAATASKALPIAATLAGGYGALRGIDSAFNTRSGVSRFVEGGYPAGGETQPMGGGMGSMRERVMAQQALAQQQKQEAKDAKAQASNEKKMAAQARTLADITSKLDTLRGNQRDPEFYKSIMDSRTTPAEMEQAVTQARNEHTLEQIQRRNAKNGPAEEPTARKATGTPEETTTTNRKAKANSVPEGEGTGAKPVEAPAATGKQKGASAKELPKGRNKGGQTKAAAKDAKTSSKKTSSDRSRRDAIIQQRRDNFTSFERIMTNKFGEQGAGVVSRLKSLDGSVNHAGEGKKALKNLHKEFGEAGKYAQDWWVKPGANLKDTRLGRTFYSKKLGKVLETAAEAKKSRGF